MIYISRTASFNQIHKNTVNDAQTLVKIQIENSIELGWQKKDIMLYTNFAFRYGQINAEVIDGVEFFNPQPQASKINCIVRLFEKNIIKKKTLYWFHDLDAFQLQPFKKTEFKLGNTDMALTDYGRLPRWSTGSIVFNYSSKDIFNLIKQFMYRYNTDEERALVRITSENMDIRKRIKKINKTYNFTHFNLRSCYFEADKPLKVVHFHPLAGIKQLGINKALDFYRGNNKLKLPLITPRLDRIFKYHRIN